MFDLNLWRLFSLLGKTIATPKLMTSWQGPIMKKDIWCTLIIFATLHFHECDSSTPLPVFLIRVKTDSKPCVNLKFYLFVCKATLWVGRYSWPVLLRNESLRLSVSKAIVNQTNDLANLVSFEPVHKISNNVVCATSKGSDQPAHTRSLIRAFASRLRILWLLSYWLNILWSF